MTMTRLADLHTHVFNVGFLPVEGILRVWHVPDKAAAKLTDVLVRLLERDPPASDVSADAGGAEAERARFMEMLQRELANPSEPQAFNDPDFFARFVAAVPQADLEALANVLTREADEDLISPAARAMSAMRLGAIVLANNDDLRRRLDRLLREVDKVAGAIEPDEEPGALVTAGVDVGGLVKWLCMLVQHESRIAAAFADAWSGKPAFDFRVHHMMDMERHYPGRPPVYDFATEQIRRMRDLAKTAKPTLIGFTAFDPFRDNWEEIIDDALKSGFSGVKFYPPNGFRPIDNATGDIVSGPKPNVVNATNVAFFRKCVEKDVPIFTHCTPSGFESRPGTSGKFSNPRHWRRVLETPGLEKLRLCFGHAGGQEGWFARDDAKGNSAWVASYAYEVVELCGTYENVYCDFGYFDRLLSGDDATYFRLRLKAAIDRYPDRFRFRCCYGTDWHLVSIKKHAKEYPKRFAEALTGILDAYRDDILFGNAKRFLKLT
jgi:predicted TIM-barrel fold metal-dependent hydrolase